MPIVDDFIEANIDTMTTAEMSHKLGVPKYLVSEKLVEVRKNLHNRGIYEDSFLWSIHKEKVALYHFIDVYKTGCLVDIAWTRVRELEKKEQG